MDIITNIDKLKINFLEELNSRKLLKVDEEGNVGYDNEKNFIDVSEYGALGDGVKDDTEDLQNAIYDASLNNIRKVFLPNREYKISKTLYIPSNIVLYGAGMDYTKLIADEDSIFDLIVPSEHDERGDLASETLERYKYIAMICTDSIKNGGVTENSKIQDLGIDWNGVECGNNSACPLYIGNAKNIDVSDVYLHDAVPLDLFGMVDNFTRGVCIMFANCDNCSIHHSIIGASDYESVSAWYIAKNIYIYNNYFTGYKSNYYKNQRHLIQITATGPTKGYSETIHSENINIFNNIMPMVQNVGQVVTAHRGDGIKIYNNKIKFYDTLIPSWGIKIFSDAKNVDIYGNTIDVTEYDKMKHGITLISMGTSAGDVGVENVKVHNNLIHAKNLGVAQDTSKWGEQSIIGSMSAINDNISVYNNDIILEDYDNNQYPIINLKGNNIRIENNNIKLINPVENITDTGFAFFTTNGGSNYIIKDNMIEGSIGNGVVSTGEVNNIVIDNNYTDLKGKPIYILEQDKAEVPAYFNKENKGEEDNQAISVYQARILLEEDLIFNVGVGLDFEDLRECLEKSAKYFSDGKYNITIIIEEGYNISDTIEMHSVDLSHVVLTTNSKVISADYRPFIFEKSILPMFVDFNMDLSTNYVINSIALLVYDSRAVRIENSTFNDFMTGLWIERSIGVSLIDANVTAPIQGDLDHGRGIYIVGSNAKLENITIDSVVTGSYDRTQSAIRCVNSNVHIDGVKLHGAFLSEIGRAHV